MPQLMRKNIVNSTINGSWSPLLGENGPFLCQNMRFLQKDTFNKLGYKAKINTHTTSYIN